MRAILRPLSIHTVFSPIETIVFIFVLATFAYFQILAGIKHSSFLAPNFPASVRPAYVRFSNQEWLGIGNGDWHDWKHSDGPVKALELQQLVFTMDNNSLTVSHFTMLICLLSRFPRSLVDIHMILSANVHDI